MSAGLPGVKELAGAAPGLLRGVLGGTPAEILALFADQVLDAARRDLRLQWPPHVAGALAPVLLPQQALVTEGICEGVTAHVDCLTTQAGVSWASFKGLPVGVQVVGPSGVHTFPLIVDEISQGQSDGTLTVVRLTCRDALSYLDRRRRLRVFRDRSAAEVVSEILQEWRTDTPLGACFDFHWRGVDRSRFPTRACFIQHPGESDGAFVRRLLRGLGVAWFWRPKAATGPTALPLQELVLFTDPGMLAVNETASMPFHQRGIDPTTPEVIDELARTWRVVPASSDLHSWDFKAARLDTMTGLTGLDQGQAGNDLAHALREARVVDPHLGDDWNELGSLARLQADSHAFRENRFDGRSSVRSLAAGTVHAVTGCPLFAGGAAVAGLRRFGQLVAGPGPGGPRLVTVRAEHFAQSNLPKLLDAAGQALLGDEGVPAWARPDSHAAAQRYTNRFASVLLGTPIVPSYLPELDDPPLRHLVGIVVVPPGDEGELHTDEFSRALVQLQGGEPGADTTVPLRHLLPVTGRNHGLVAHLRRGTEVVVDFFGPDRPFILGALPNGTNPPARPSQMPGLPANKSQTALVSRELGARRQQHLLFDDYPGQLMTQLASEAGHTSLSLGELTTRRIDGAAKPRGNGFGLVTQHHGTIRTAMRLLLTAWGQWDVDGGQLDAQEHVQLMQASLDLFRALGQYAAQHQGLALDDGPHAALAAAVQAAPDLDDPAKAGAEPTVSITAPAGVATTTPQTIVHYAGTNIDSVAQQHLNLTAGQQFNLNAGQGVGLFAHHKGISAIAHHGPLMLQAQHDGARIEAATDITWTASGGKLTGMAQEIHLIAADGSFVKIGGGGVTIGTNGPITQQAASFTHSGPATMQTQFPTFGAGQADQRFVLRAAGTGGPALPHAAYEITLSDGSTVSGVSDDQGLTDLLQRDALHIANLRLQKKDA